MIAKRKRPPVVMTVKPPYTVLKALAGNPLILAASDEVVYREWYKRLRRALQRHAKGKPK